MIVKLRKRKHNYNLLLNFSLMVVLISPLPEEIKDIEEQTQVGNFCT